MLPESAARGQLAVSDPREVYHDLDGRKEALDHHVGLCGGHGPGRLRHAANQ